MSEEIVHPSFDIIRTSRPINEELYWLQQPVVVVTEDDGSLDDVLSQFNISYSNPRNNFASSTSFSSMQHLANPLSGPPPSHKTSSLAPTCFNNALRDYNSTFQSSTLPK